MLEYKTMLQVTTFVYINSLQLLANELYHMAEDLSMFWALFVLIWSSVAVVWSTQVNADRC